MRSSFEKINYALRPAKNAQRKMISEFLSRLVKLAPMAKYRYVGFGSVGFHDFSLFHRRLGLTDMWSIEGAEKAKERFKKNKPFGHIRMKWGLSNEKLPEMRWSQRAIIWLDYDYHLDDRVLADVQLITGQVRSGSVLIVTVGATPSDDLPSARMDDLIRRVGADRIPTDVSKSSLAGWGLAVVSAKILANEIHDTLRIRNAPEDPAENQISFEKALHFQYADGAKMLTYGGLLVNARDRERLGATFFNDLDFICRGDKAFRIESPMLTATEFQHVNQSLGGSSEVPSWIPAKEVKKYKKIYRYFPTFVEMEP